MKLGRIASLYLPFVDILIENLTRLNNNQSKPSLNPNMSVSSGDSSFTTAKQNGASFISSNTLMPSSHPLHSSVSLSHSENNRQSETSSVLGVIAGNSKLQDHLEAIIGPMSDSDSLSSADDANFKNLNKRTSSSLITGSTTNSDNITNSVNISASIANTETSTNKSYTVTRKDKLDNNETKDLLICLVFILKNLSHGKHCQILMLEKSQKRLSTRDGNRGIIFRLISVLFQSNLKKFYSKLNIFIRIFKKINRIIKY